MKHFYTHTQTYEPFLGDQQNLEVREGEIGFFFPPFIECKPVTIPGKSQTDRIKPSSDYKYHIVRNIFILSNKTPFRPHTSFHNPDNLDSIPTARLSNTDFHQELQQKKYVSTDSRKLPHKRNY